LTICLALLCDNGNQVVAAADRMVSVEFLSLQFEQHARKVDHVGEHTVALTAGDALGHTEILREATQEISRLSQPNVSQVAAQVEACFIHRRQQLAENSVLRRVGMDYDTFLQQQRNLAPELVSTLISAYKDVELDIELLIAGVDSTGGHLYLISDPGITNCFDSIGYAAIGSGLPHAESFLTEADYSPKISVNRAIWLCYIAKRRSERAPGVGSKYTDVLVIDREQGVRFLDDQTLQRLDSFYQQYLTSLLEATRAIDRSVADLDLTYQA
jgi:20S proteasome alpha/beta subunit